MKFDGLFIVKYFQLLINYDVMKTGLTFIISGRYKWIVGLILNTCIDFNLELYIVLN